MDPAAPIEKVAGFDAAPSPERFAGPRRIEKQTAQVDRQM